MQVPSAPHCGHLSTFSILLTLLAACPCLCQVVSLCLAGFFLQLTSLGNDGVINLVHIENDVSCVGVENVRNLIVVAAVGVISISLCILQHLLAEICHLLNGAVVGAPGLVGLANDFSNDCFLLDKEVKDSQEIAGLLTASVKVHSTVPSSSVAFLTISSSFIKQPLSFGTTNGATITLVLPFVSVQYT